MDGVAGRLPGAERPRDRYGRPLPWGAVAEIEMHDYDGMSIAENLDLAADAFNAGVYFTAHEAWEGAWRKARGTADEELFKGLAQLGAGYTHMQRGNAHGARTLLARGVSRIAAGGPARHGLDLASLCAAAESHVAVFEADEIAGRRATRVQTPHI